MESCFGLPCPPLPKLAARQPDSHKGDFGHALLIGGSRGMSGAISLAGVAALHTGAGLVSLAVPDRCLESVAAHSPCLMTVALPDDSTGRIAASAIDSIAERMDRATCIAIGPAWVARAIYKSSWGTSLRLPPAQS